MAVLCQEKCVESQEITLRRTRLRFYSFNLLYFTEQNGGDEDYSYLLNTPRASVMRQLCPV